MAAVDATTLRPIDRCDLKIGQELPGHVRNDRGRILIRAGRVLTEEDLALLGNEELTVGPDWPFAVTSRRPAPGTCSPAALIEQLLSQGQGSDKSAKEKRGCTRHPYRATLVLAVQETESNSTSRRVIEVVTSDISMRGFSFVFDQYVTVGALVRVRFDGLPKKPSVSGVVRNCSHLRGRKHRVGVQFMTREEGR